MTPLNLAIFFFTRNTHPSHLYLYMRAFAPWTCYVFLGILLSQFDHALDLRSVTPDVKFSFGEATAGRIMACYDVWTHQVCGSTRVYPGYEGISGVRGYIRGTRVYPGYEGISGIRGYIRDTRVYPGYEGISGIRGYIRDTRVRGYIRDTRV